MYNVCFVLYNVCTNVPFKSLQSRKVNLKNLLEVRIYVSSAGRNQSMDFDEIGICSLMQKYLKEKIMIYIFTL